MAALVEATILDRVHIDPEGECLLCGSAVRALLFGSFQPIPLPLAQRRREERGVELAHELGIWRVLLGALDPRLVEGEQPLPKRVAEIRVCLSVAGDYLISGRFRRWAPRMTRIVLERKVPCLRRGNILGLEEPRHRLIADEGRGCDPFDSSSCFAKTRRPLHTARRIPQQDSLFLEGPL